MNHWQATRLHNLLFRRGSRVVKQHQIVGSAVFCCALGYCAGLAVFGTLGNSQREARVDSPALFEGQPFESEFDTAAAILPPRSASTDQQLAISDCGLLGCDSDASLLVQEPSRRSAYRPDLSGGIRNSNFRSNFFMLQAFKEALDESWQCTVQVYCGDDQCSYGTIVDTDGWIITKASELDGNRDITCTLSDQREFPATLISTLVDLDLALLRIPIAGLPTVQWDYSIPGQGNWLATTDCRSGLPVAIGVVSTGPSKIPNQPARLGVELASDDSKSKAGARIKHVLGGSGAFKAGLRKEDIISSVDGTSVNSRDQLLSLLRSGKGGQFLNLTVYRDEEFIERRVRLMDLSHELLDETEMEVNGPISARSTGFNRVFMHDTVLQPNQCGGPLINLDGKAVGINIARAGRVSTYALPSDTVRPAVQGLLEQAKLISYPSPASARNSAASAADISDSTTPLMTAP